MGFINKIINYILGYPKKSEVLLAQQENKFRQLKRYYTTYNIEVTDQAIWDYIKGVTAEVHTDGYKRAIRWAKMSKAKTEEEFLLALKGNANKWDLSKEYDYLIELASYLKCMKHKYITETEMWRYIKGERSLFNIRDKFDELEEAKTKEERQKILNDNMFGY